MSLELAEPQPDPVRLLLQAIETLTPAERGAVLAWLLERGAPVAPGMPFVGVGSSLEAPVMHGGVPAGFGSARGSGGDLQMVPLRFPVGQHQQLRTWCSEHNFSMATVVRGLVGKFLDEQGQSEQGHSTV